MKAAVVANNSAADPITQIGRLTDGASHFESQQLGVPCEGLGLRCRQAVRPLVVRHQSHEQSIQVNQALNLESL
jgi:hypothetical protein